MDLSLLVQKNKFHALSNWFSSPRGEPIANAFAAKLIELQELGILTGETLLQLGGPANCSWLAPLKYKYKWQVTPDYDSKTADLIAAFKYFPFGEHSFDSIIAPLTMAAYSGKENPIDEMNRALKPMGSIVFLEINPLSIYSLLMRLAKQSCFGQIPTNTCAVNFLRQEMHNRGYEQCYYNKLTSNPGRGRYIPFRWAFINQFIDLICIRHSGFYCLVMKKFNRLPPKLKIFTKSKLEDSSLEPVCWLK